jgi:oligosaccharide repeat unit polymerase
LLFILVASLPRVIRHGGLAVFSSGHGDLNAAVSYNAAVAGTKEGFEDYASGLAAFSAFFDHREEPTWGMRTFTPVWRMANRLGVIDSGNYITTIDRPSENIYPIYYNLYTLLRDLYQDFGLLGIACGAISFGFAYGRLFTVSGVTGRAITIMMTTWLLYTPFYNAFSFGTLLIPFCLLLSLAFWCRMVSRSRPSEATCLIRK